MFIYGASGHGLVIWDILQQQNIVVDAFLDDFYGEPHFRGLPVVKPEILSQRSNVPVILGIGDNEARKVISHKLSVEFATAVHPTAIISNSAEIGPGSVVMAMAVVNPYVQIGKHVIINTAATVDHECELGDYVHISPNATLAGRVKVGECTHIGAGSVVIQGIRIGKGCVVGAGAVVIRDVPDNAIVVGNPAKLLRYRTPV